MIRLLPFFALLALGCADGAAPTAPDSEPTEAKLAAQALTGRSLVSVADTAPYTVTWDLAADRYRMTQMHPDVGLIYWEEGIWWLEVVHDHLALVRTRLEGGILQSDDTWGTVTIPYTLVQEITILSPGGPTDAQAVVLQAPGYRAVTYQVVSQ